MQVLRNPTPDNSAASIVRHCVEEEALAITELSKNLDVKAIELAVDLVSKCQGKILTSGVGKSWYVAEKLAATLASTGTVAYPIDALHAGHGDSGNIRFGDVGIFFSKSGSTRELLLMLPLFKSRGVPVIAIVGDINSPLALQADVILDATVSKETCPFNRVPTTSVTIALVLGNALAVAVMIAKGITIDIFADNHPDGKLGEILQLQIAKQIAELRSSTSP